MRLRNIIGKGYCGHPATLLVLVAEHHQFYCQLGQMIIEKQAQTAWGSKFLEQLSKDLQADFPGTGGFSKRNLELMRQFAQLYPEIAKQAVSQLPWGHIILLMQQVKDPRHVNGMQIMH
jgi:predicted nuclease of restriction endonuclease-like (RecB) superfamily